MPDVDALFEQALDLSPADRPAFLDRACRTPDGAPDTALRARLARLLAAADAPDSFLDRPEALLGETRLGALAASALRPPTRSITGARVGPYEVDELVGEGGMGAVYRAHRADGAFRQDVALKLVRPGLGLTSPATQARFEQERQVLAALDHPGIARLLGGGRTDPNGPLAGAPYLAMEFVDGAPITTYADEQRLDVKMRIGLIRQACAAVQHAHGRLVVHRDLKPSNMLVDTDDEGQPRVKVLDFGIAKLLGEGDAADPMLTQTGVRLLTPAYAAPEQFRDGAATTSADVYALGVLLYELLTGRWPYATGAVDKRSATEIERLVLENVPVRASTAAQREGDLATRAFARRESPARFVRHLRGDLDLICAKALHADPARRYASAAALSDDLGRYLEGLPVEARPDSAGYRFSRLVKRHPVGSSASAIGLLALLAALGTALWQADRAETSFASEQVARQTAEEETERATSMVTFMTNMIGSMDPALTGDSLISVREMLDAGRVSAEDLADRPVLYASTLFTLGNLYKTLGDTEVGLELLEAGNDALGPDDPPSLRTSLASGMSVMLTRLGRLQEAGEQARRAMDLADEHAGQHPDVVYTATSSLARSYENAGRYAEAEALWRRIAHGLEQAGDDLEWDSPNFVITYHGLASALAEQGKDREAIGYYEKLIALVDSSSNLPPVAAGGSISRLSNLLARAERYDEALPLLRQSWTITKDVYGPDHLQTLAAEINFARGLAYTGAHGEADQVSRKVHEALVAMFGADGLYPALTLAKRARILIELNRFEEAEAAIHESRDALEAALGPDHPDVRRTEALLGLLYLRSGEAEQAAPLLRAAYEAERAVGGDASTNTALAAALLADALAALGEGREARALYTKALETLDAQYPGSPATRRIRDARGALAPTTARSAATDRDEA